MFIQTDTTPNPQTLKFLPGRDVSPDCAYEFLSVDEANSSSPLAAALFNIEGVRAVFLGKNYISLTKTDPASWDALKPQALAVIADHFVSGTATLLSHNHPENHEPLYEGEVAEIVEEVKNLLETRVRPAVAADGGDIRFCRFNPETGLVSLQMRGACAGCPSAELTLKAGVENLLRHYIPEVTAVEAVEEL